MQKLYKNMQLSKLRGCKTYLPNYAVAAQRKLHLHMVYLHLVDFYGKRR